MPSPTARQSHIDTALTNISIAYANARYVYDQAFPIVKVQKQTDKYFVFDKSAWFRDEAATRAPGAKAARSEYSLTASNMYVCVEKALSKLVTDEEVDNADAPLTPWITSTKFVTDKLMLAQEVDVVGLLFGTGWSSSATPSTLWSNDAADPLGDIETAMDTVAKAIGREPNVGVIGRGLWRYVKNHPDIVDRLKYGQTAGGPAMVTLAGFAALAGLDKVVVAAAIKESAQEGATSSIAYVGGNHMWLGYVPSSPALGEPAAGYNFQWKTREVNRYRDEEAHTGIVECRVSWDAKITAPDAGYLIKSAA